MYLHNNWRVNLDITRHRNTSTKKMIIIIIMIMIMGMGLKGCSCIVIDHLQYTPTSQIHEPTLESQIGH